MKKTITKKAAEAKKPTTTDKKTVAKKTQKGCKESPIVKTTMEITDLSLLRSILQKLVKMIGSILLGKNVPDDELRATLKDARKVLKNTKTN